MTDLHKTAFRGAQAILSQGLSLRRDDNLSVFFDEDTQEVADVVMRAAADLEIDVSPRLTPLAQQAAHDPRRSLSQDDLSALSEARGILTCLSASPQGTAYRYALLDAGTNDWKYFGHMPGATLELLALADTVDYAAASRKCDDLAVAMNFGETAIVETYERPADRDNPGPHLLKIDLTGPSPITSTGIIPRGTWGNVPGGETFISPREWTASGEFVLNGAFLDWVVPPGSPLILRFEEGRLLDPVQGSGETYARFIELLKRCEMEAGSCWRALAEFGIGANDGILELTGNSLLDEKCAGTAHIAIGDGRRYGGAVECDIHEDLITWHPSIWIDTKQILKRGELVFRSDQWRDSIFEPPANGGLRRGMKVARSDRARAEAADGRLVLHKRVALGRACSYTVGDAASSPLIGHIYEMIPATPVTVASLISNLPSHISAERLHRGIEILLRHHLIYEGSV